MYEMCDNRINKDNKCSVVSNKKSNRYFLDDNNLQKELKIESLLSCESVELTSRTFSETEKNHNNSDFGKFNWQR
jgi:hypothetical protein